VARTDQERLGKIFRRNIAYGTLTRHGTIFVGFSHDQGTLRTMLASMLGAEGGPDKLLAVTRPLTGAYYSSHRPICLLPSMARPERMVDTRPSLRERAVSTTAGHSVAPRIAG
jgi:hypothetical protein